MECVTKINENLYYVGGSERKIHLFENMFPVPNGVSYNSYLLVDEKTVLFDTVDWSIGDLFLENIEFVLNGRPLDYLIVNHMELDHSKMVKVILEKYPTTKVVLNQKALAMLNAFVHSDYTSRAIIVNEFDTLKVGEHEFTFVFAPMVHWPEVMMTYDKKDKILFSADAFGSFGSLDGNIFSSDIDIDSEYYSEMRRYYANIVGKFGQAVTNVLNKAKDLEIKMICPLHGAIWNDKIDIILRKYKTWSSYLPEDNTVSIYYASMYGNTENACYALANALAKRNIKNIKMFDVSKTDISYLISDVFRTKTIVIASPTYNGGLYPKKENFLTDLNALNVQKKNDAIIENGTWAITASKLIKKHLEPLKNITLINKELRISSNLCNNQKLIIDEMADEIGKSLEA